MPRIRLADSARVVAALSSSGGDRLQPDFEQVLLELGGCLRRIRVVGLVGDDVVAARLEARDTGRIGSVQTGDRSPPCGADRREGLDARFVACEWGGVFPIADAQTHGHALVRKQGEAGRLDPELVRHRRRGPACKQDEREARDEVAHAPPHCPESLLLLTPECGVARYGNTWWYGVSFASMLSPTFVIFA